jgi:putative transposase
MKNEVKHTAHSSYRCEYHIVFAPKYRRKVIYRELRRDIGEIFRKLCAQMKVEIIEAEACPDHIHMLVSIPPYMSVAQFVGTLKSKSALMIFDRHANLKYKYGNRHFWARGYFCDTVGKNERMIREYIQKQLETDVMEDQISLKEYMDPFTGEKSK